MTRTAARHLGAALFAILTAVAVAGCVSVPRSSLQANWANPQLAGDLELIDSETGQGVEVSMGLAVMRRYHQRLSALQAELKSFAMRGGGKSHVCVTTTALRDFVFGPLRESRLLR